MPPVAAPTHPRTATAHEHSNDHGHSHDREHSHEHGHAHGVAHRHSHPHGHTHSSAHHHPGHRHPAARPAPSLLRLSAWQRLGIVLPLAALLWAATFWVIYGGAS